MTKKESKIQNALGLMKTYVGYIRILDTSDYIVYEVNAITYKAARHRLKKICKLNDDYILEYVGIMMELLPSRMHKVNIIERRSTIA